MERFWFSEFGTDLKLTGQAEQENFPRLDHFLNDLQLGTVVVFDLNGLEFLGYSYAKQTIRRSFRRFLEGRYRLKAIALAYDGNDYEEFLDGVRAALAEQELTMWLSVQGEWIPFGYLSTEGDKASKKEIRKKAKMRDVLEFLKALGECGTNEISSALDLTLQNANHLLQDLADMRLIERRKVSSPTGGPLYVNALIAT